MATLSQSKESLEDFDGTLESARLEPPGRGTWVSTLFCKSWTNKNRDCLKFCKYLTNYGSTTEQEKTLDTLLGSDAFQYYSVVFLVAYPILYIAFIIMYAASEPSFLAKSFQWQVWVPFAYLGLLVVVLLLWGNRKTVRLAVRYASFLFYLGIYHHVFYLLDNLKNFPEIFENLVQKIDDIADMFNTRDYWVVIGIIIAVCTVVGIFTLSLAGLFIGVPIITLIYLFWAFLFFLMLVLPFSLYLYQIIIFLVCPYWTLYDTISSLHKFQKLQTV
jgi:hypothetical protein